MPSLYQQSTTGSSLSSRREGSRLTDSDTIQKNNIHGWEAFYCTHKSHFLPSFGFFVAVGWEEAGLFVPDTAAVSFVTAVGGGGGGGGGVVVDIRMVMMESGLDSRDITLLIQP